MGAWGWAALGVLRGVSKDSVGVGGLEWGGGGEAEAASAVPDSQRRLSGKEGTSLCGGRRRRRSSEEQHLQAHSHCGWFGYDQYQY